MEHKINRDTITLDPVIAKMDTSPTLATKLKVMELKERGKEISNFGLGESPFGGPPNVIDSIASQAYRTEYLPTAGIPELRHEISEFYEQYFGYKFDKSRVIVAPGSKELLFNVMLATDSKWFFFAPSWVSYEAQAKMLNKSYWRVHLSYKDDFKITEKVIKKRFREIDDQLYGKQLSMLINYPNNPTGQTISNAEVRKIARFARNNEILILSDEIYANITHDGYKDKHLSFGIEYAEGTIVTGGISKDRSMGGTRFGVAIMPEGQPLLTKAMKSIGSETYSCVSAPVQYGIIRAYDQNSEVDSHIRDSTSIHSLIGKTVYAHLKKSNYKIGKPEGAFYLMPSMNDKQNKLNEIGIFTSTDLTDYLLQKYNIAAIPGVAFGLRRDDLSFRIAYIDYDGNRMLESFRLDKDEAINNSDEFVMNNAPSLYRGLQSFKKFADKL